MRSNLTLKLSSMFFEVGGNLGSVLTRYRPPGFLFLITYFSGNG
jgi:hypothetical protein